MVNLLSEEDEDDLEGDLGPMGDERDDAPLEDPEDEQLDELDDDLDDSTSEDDPVTDTVDVHDDGPEDEAEGTLDDGGAEDLEAPDAVAMDHGDDAPGIAMDDVTIDEEAIGATGDGGEEGLDEAEQEIDETGLPPLDSDGDDPMDSDEEEELLVAHEGRAKSDDGWDLVFFRATDAPLTCLAARDGGAYGWADGLFFLSEVGDVRRLAATGLDATPIALAARGEVLDATISEGTVLRSVDHGASFSRVDTTSEAIAPSELRLRSGDPVRFSVDASRGRLQALVGAKVVAELSDDVDSDADDATVRCFDRRDDVVWIGTEIGVLCYRTR